LLHLVGDLFELYTLHCTLTITELPWDIRTLSLLRVIKFYYVSLHFMIFITSLNYNVLFRFKYRL